MNLLLDKKDDQIRTLSGGMKPRVADRHKAALLHEPQILFLDEPTAGVDVELRKDMWEVVRSLRASGVTIIPHHPLHRGKLRPSPIRIGVFNHGQIILVEGQGRAHA